MALVARIAPASALVQDRRRRALTAGQGEECHFEYASSAGVASFPQQSIAPSRFYSLQSTPRTREIVTEHAADMALRAAQAASLAADECVQETAFSREESSVERRSASSGLLCRRFLPVEDARSASVSCATARSSLDSFRVTSSSMGDGAEARIHFPSNEMSSETFRPSLGTRNSEASTASAGPYVRRKSFLTRTTSAAPAVGSTGGCFETQKEGHQNGLLRASDPAATAQAGRASVGYFSLNCQSRVTADSVASRLSSCGSASSVDSVSLGALAGTCAASESVGNSEASEGNADAVAGTSSRLVALAQETHAGPRRAGRTLSLDCANEEISLCTLGVVRQVTGETSRLTSRMSVFMEDAAAVAISLADDAAFAADLSGNSAEANTTKDPTDPPAKAARLLPRHASMPALMPADEHQLKVSKESMPPTLTPQDLLKLQRAAKKNFNSRTFLSGATLKSLLKAPEEKQSTTPAQSPVAKSQNSFASRAAQAARDAAAAAPSGNFSRVLSLPEETDSGVSFFVMEKSEEGDDGKQKGRRRRRLVILEDEDEIDILTASAYYARRGFATPCRDAGDRFRVFLQRMAKLCW
ncbi:hypothetical protein TGGT1_221990 [Toxoplasma gondii GT1]|uniref:Uncharacterized protein n=3 Tax=Toxoplasma gondii TaxID=5811 RepID=S7VTW4_TOXGG|nr:hypothetical protein TGGT1_221990 [Toxoplasma gondii GT1]KAF4645613.1 hypothetical protein TGRH88_000990 [Toxoplasma gondii]KFG47620.1 hypothetical protein TGFOU_221990 [Toxoplasma gondii FOU]